MKNRVRFLVLMFITISCNNKKEYYENGSISKEYNSVDGKIDGVYREYYPNQNLKKLCFYTNGILKDSLVHYYDNKQNSIRSVDYFSDNNDTIKKVFFREDGSKIKIGHILQNRIMVGEWFFYHKNGIVSQKIEYLNIGNKEYVNQGWYYNEDGKEIEDSGNYITIETKSDTVKIEEPLVFLFSLAKPYFSYESDVYVCLPRNKLSDVKQDFSNIEKIPLDTFVSIKNEKIVNDFYKYNRQVSFGLTFSEEGDINIRGFFTEKYPNNGGYNIDKKHEIIERKIYFNKKIYVRK